MEPLQKPSAPDDAQRQLAWSREYLAREKRRRRFVRTAVAAVLVIFAAAAVFVLRWQNAAPANAVSAVFKAAGIRENSGILAPASSASAVEASSVPSKAAPGAGDAAAFTVIFDSRGGSKVAAAEQVSSGALLPEPEPPVREGYEFAGWYCDAARTQAWDFARDTVREDLTLYAAWRDAPAEDVQETVLPQTGMRLGAAQWALLLVASVALLCMVVRTGLTRFC